MLRQLAVFTALVALGVALARPALASEITGSVALSGGIDYTDDNGTMNFFTTAQSGAHSDAIFSGANNAGGSGGSLTLDNGFVYNGGISPAVFTLNEGGKTGELTLTSLNSLAFDPDGIDVTLSGTFDQAGYAQELATASFLLNSDYIGNNVNWLMFRGFAQLTPGATPEPDSLALFSTGVLALAGAGLLRRKLTMADAKAVDIA